MKHTVSRRKRYHSSGRRILRKLIESNSAGFMLGDDVSLHESLIDIESGRRFTRTAVSQCLRTLSHKQTT